VFTEPSVEPIPGESGNKIVDRQGNPVTDLCYLNISQFHDRTLSELRTKAGKMESSGCTGLILDVRSNGGGLLSATVDVADEFLDKGVILSEAGASGDKKVTNATPGGILTDLPIVILQDAGSASGAEVLAAALHDNGRARIIGTRSFGKGTVNQLVQLDNCGDPKDAAPSSPSGAGTRRTVSRSRPGITPDVEVPMTDDIWPRRPPALQGHRHAPRQLAARCPR
jgi:carboxyl-terminal processing protease